MAGANLAVGSIAPDTIPVRASAEMIGVEPGGALPIAIAAEVGLFVVMERWMAWLAATGRANSNTARQYRRYALAFMADTLVDLRSLSEDDIITWTQQRDDAGKLLHDPRGEGFGQTIRALRSFARFATDRGLMVEDPTRHIRLPRPKRRPPAKTPDPDLERLFAEAAAIDPRAGPTLELIFATGARLASVAAAMPGDVDLDAGTIYWRVAKHDDPYTSYLGRRGKRAASTLLELADYRPPRAARRPTLVGVGEKRIYQWVQEAGQRAGLHFWTHRLRHEFLHRVANDPRLPALVVAKMANHKDPRMTLVYADPDEALMRAGVDPL